jgi:tRNA wybutosine-synthesizing protein 2
MHNYAVVLEDAKSVKKAKQFLEEQKSLNKKLKISSDPNTGSFTIPVLCTTEAESIELLEELQNKIPNISFKIQEIECDTSENSSNKIQLEKLLLSFNTDAELIPKLLADLPKRYSVYPPLLLFPINSLDTKTWSTYLASLDQCQCDLIFKLILQIHSTPTNNLTHLAINKPIPECDNVIRSPTQLTVLYGDFTKFWCHTIQNGIYQTWMPLHTMFSRGNIKEKARILSKYKNISEETDIVDMYAGIGYFTLSYLKRGAKRLFCWEINAFSVEGLSRGVKQNGFGDVYMIKRNEPVLLEKVLNSKCIVFLESNEYCLDRFNELKYQETENLKLNLSVAHINLGLLPTSTESWPLACKLIDLYSIQTSFAWVHVHENIGVSDLETFMDETRVKLQELTKTREVNSVYLEKVKTFAPDVYHVVGDFEFL